MLNKLSKKKKLEFFEDHIGYQYQKNSSVWINYQKKNGNNNQLCVRVGYQIIDW